MPWRRPVTLAWTSTNAANPADDRQVNELVTTGATVEELGLEERVGVGSEEFENLLVLRMHRTPAVEDAVSGTSTTNPADVAIFENRQYALRSVTREYPNSIIIRAERQE